MVGKTCLQPYLYHPVVSLLYLGYGTHLWANITSTDWDAEDPWVYTYIPYMMYLRDYGMAGNISLKDWITNELQLNVVNDEHLSVWFLQNTATLPTSRSIG
jgi:hypothetical protein